MAIRTRFARDEIVDSLEAAFRAAAHGHGDFEALIAVGGALLVIDDGLGMTQRARSYDAIGSGAAVTLGALAALRNSRLKARADDLPRRERTPDTYYMV